MYLTGALAVALLSGLYLALTEDAAPSAGLRPAGAVDYALEHGLTTGNVINSYNYGGYLISRHIPTFIDGRGVVFGHLLAQFFFPSTESWEAMCDKYHVTWALFEAQSAQSVYFNHSPRWKPVYADDQASVFERIPQVPID